jgi:hypothetical protein
VEQHEEGSCTVCRTLPYLSADQSRTSETNGDAQTINHSIMEVGTYSHGLCHEFTKDGDWIGCSLGSGRSSDEVGTFSAH